MPSENLVVFTIQIGPIKVKWKEESLMLVELTKNRDGDLHFDLVELNLACP